MIKGQLFQAQGKVNYQVNSGNGEQNVTNAC